MTLSLSFPHLLVHLYDDDDDQYRVRRRPWVCVKERKKEKKTIPVRKHLC